MKAGIVVVSKINVSVEGYNNVENAGALVVTVGCEEGTARGLISNFVYIALDGSYGNIGKISGEERTPDTKSRDLSTKYWYGLPTVSMHHQE